MEVVITDMDYEVDYYEEKTRKILVLGSGGQVGAYLTEYLRCADVEVMEFDITNGSHQDMTMIPNGELEAKIYMADFVYFLAFDVGGSHYLKKYQHTFNFIDNNTRLMANAFGLIEKYKKPFVFASSQMSNMSYSPYGVLKRVGELYTKSLGGLIVKFWNVYGIEKDHDKAHVITDFIRKGFESGDIDMMTDGTEAREFLYAEDCCEALETVMEAYTISVLRMNFILLLVFIQLCWRLRQKLSHYFLVLERRSRLLQHNRRMKCKKMLGTHQILS